MKQHTFTHIHMKKNIRTHPKNAHVFEIPKLPKVADESRLTVDENGLSSDVE